MAKVDAAPTDAQIDSSALAKGLRCNWLLILGGASITAALLWAACFFLVPVHRTNDVASLPNQSAAADNLDLDALRSQIRAAETAAWDYRASRQLLTSQNNGEIAARQISEISAEARQIRTARLALEAKADSIRQALASGEPVEMLPDILAAGAMQQLADYRLQLNTLLAELTARLRANDPRIKALRAQYADLERQARTAGRLLLSGLEKESAAAKLREDELNGDLEREKAQLAIADEAQSKLRRLEGEVASLGHLLTDRLATERKQVKAPRVSVAASMVDFPNLLWWVPTVGFILSAILLAALALLREMFRGQTSASTPVSLSAVNEIAMPQHDIAADVPLKPALETVAGNPHGVKAIADRLCEGDAKRIVVVSPEGDEASATTVRLLRELADRSKRCILVDMSAYGALALAMLDGHRHAGLTELLLGRKRFNEVIHSDRFSQAHVMPLGEADPAHAMRSADHLPFILDALETVYDFVLVECGPTSAAQLEWVAEGGITLVMSVIDPDSEAVMNASLDLDRGGYEEMLILMDSPFTV
ncbi:hypothetical protein AAIB41_04240 [Brucella sp. BE17]|uniref:hypothetical protein n=1 Tax=Brucella sp. BE17 TaxID=3142977 RepID=UPI0031BB9C7A